MGFEMLGSRYLFPYFGGGMGTWAGLISTVLVALTVGYLGGGAIVDRHPSPRVVAVSIAVAAVYLALIPLTADRVMSSILRSVGEGPVGVLLASSVLLLLPLSLLGTLSPVAATLRPARFLKGASKWCGERVSVERPSTQTSRTFSTSLFAAASPVSITTTGVSLRNARSSPRLGFDRPAETHRSDGEID